MYFAIKNGCFYKSNIKKHTVFVSLSPGQWMWLDKTVMDYSNWGVYRRKDGKHGEIYSSSGTWTPRSKWSRRPYICKTAKGKNKTNTQ